MSKFLLFLLAVTLLISAFGFAAPPPSSSYSDDQDDDLIFEMELEMADQHSPLSPVSSPPSSSSSSSHLETFIYGDVDDEDDDDGNGGGMNQSGRQYLQLLATQNPKIIQSLLLIIDIDIDNSMSQQQMQQMQQMQPSIIQIEVDLANSYRKTFQGKIREYLDRRFADLDSFKGSFINLLTELNIRFIKESHQILQLCQSSNPDPSNRFNRYCKRFTGGAKIFATEIIMEWKEELETLFERVITLKNEIVKGGSSMKLESKSYVSESIENLFFTSFK